MKFQPIGVSVYKIFTATASAREETLQAKGRRLRILAPLRLFHFAAAFNADAVAIPAFDNVRFPLTSFISIDEPPEPIRAFNPPHCGSVLLISALGKSGLIAPAMPQVCKSMFTWPLKRRSTSPLIPPILILPA